MAADIVRPLSEQEISLLLTQEEADLLPEGAMIYFKNVQHGPLLEKISRAKGQGPTKKGIQTWKDGSPCSCLSDPEQSWLYNVGVGGTHQQVYIADKIGKAAFDGGYAAFKKAQEEAKRAAT